MPSSSGAVTGSRIFVRASGLCQLDHYASFSTTTRSLWRTTPHGEQRPERAPHPSSVSKRGGCCILWIYSDDMRSDTRGGEDTGPNPGPLTHGGNDTVLG